MLLNGVLHFLVILKPKDRIEQVVYGRSAGVGQSESHEPRIPSAAGVNTGVNNNRKGGLSFCPESVDRGVGAILREKIKTPNGDAATLDL